MCKDTALCFDIQIIDQIETILPPIPLWAGWNENSLRLLTE